MRYLSIFLVMLLIGMAGAQSTWYPRSADYNTTGDVNADNGHFTGDFTIDGTLGVGTNVSNGVFSEDIALGAGYDWYSIAGAGVVDFGNMTGYFKGPTGEYTLGGNVTISGTKTFASGTGAFDINGEATTRNITLDANKNVVLSGTGTVSGAATVAGTALTASGTVQGEQVTSTDDARIADDLTANDLVVNATADINGATTTATVTVDSGSIVTADQYKRRATTTATNTTITDGGADLYLVGNGTGVNSQTIILPTAADNKGRIITVILATDPLANTVIIDGEGSEQVDGANTKTTTDAVGSMYHLICSGTAWIKLASAGTWS